MSPLWEKAMAQAGNGLGRFFRPDLLEPAEKVVGYAGERSDAFVSGAQIAFGQKRKDRAQ